MNWLRRIFLRRRMQDDLSEEIRQHLDEKIEVLVSEGMSREEAGYQAKREFGNVTRIEERSREAWMWPLLESIWADAKFAVRQLRKSPGFAVTAMLTLALGIGANTAIFSLVNSYLIRPLPYRDPTRLVVIWEQLKVLGINRFRAPIANYLDYRRLNHVFEDVAGVQDAHPVLTNAGPPEQLLALSVTANLFPLMGIRSALGRTFVDEENQPGHEREVLLSDAVWRRNFGGDPAILNRNITLDGARYQVVGVLPANLRFTVGDVRLPDVWIPLPLTPDPNRDSDRLELIGRLKGNVSLQQAQANMDSVAAQLENQYHLYRGPHGEDAGYAVSLVSLRDNLVGDMRSGLLLMLGAVALVLLIACANVANLLLAHGVNREQELSLRIALGARRSGILQLLLVEALLLATAGGVLGLGLGFGGVQLLRALSPYEMSALFDVSVDWTALLFTALLSVFTAVLFGLVPSLLILRGESSQALKRSAPHVAGDRSRRILRHGLVIGETALSVSLAIGVGLLLHSFILLERVPLGFNPEGLITGRISLPSSAYRTNQQIAAFWSELARRVAARPDIHAFGIASSLPVADNPNHDPFSIEGRSWRPFGAAGIPQFTNTQAVSESYFRATGIPLLKGRLLSDSDREGSQRVAIVNDAMVRGFWPEEDPIGKHILLGAPRPDAPWLTIVGVVGDVRSAGPESDILPEIYTSILQTPRASAAVVVRPESAGANNVIATVRGAVQSIDKSVPLHEVAPYDQLLSGSFATRRYYLLLLSGFGGLALVLAAIGTYGVISYSVALRTPEIGIRLAFGAPRSNVLGAVIGQGLRLAGAGVVLGLLAALGLSRFLASYLFGVRTTDPLTYCSVALVLMLTALAASYFPARRAASVDPMQALRAE